MSEQDDGWVRLEDDLATTNETTAAKALGGIAKSSVWWQPSTGRIVGRLQTTAGAAARDEATR